MGIYIQNANIKFLFNFKNNKFDDFFSNTIEKSLKGSFNKMSFITKTKILRNTLLIMDDKDIIGYIWCENLKDYVVYIRDISISTNYLNNSKTFKVDSSFNLKNNKVFSYDGYHFQNFNSIMLKLGFNCINKSLLKTINLEDFNNKCILEKTNTSLVQFIENKDEVKRCKIQNDIFEDESRIPLTVDDIYLDELQEYYLKDYSFFVKYNDNYIGYAQIIKFNGSYLIVNLGIVPKYRNMGFGEYLLNNLLLKLKKDKIEKVFIRVSEQNKLAIKLYDKIGFKTQCVIDSYKL